MSQPTPRRRHTAPSASTGQSLVHVARARGEDDFFGAAGRPAAPAPVMTRPTLVLGGMVLAGMGALLALLVTRPGGPSAAPAVAPAPVVAVSAGNDSASCLGFRSRMDDVGRLLSAGTIGSEALSAITDSLSMPSTASRSCAERLAMVNTVVTGNLVRHQLYQTEGGIVVERSGADVRRSGRRP